MILGTEWLVDASGCDPDLLKDVQVLQDTCARIVTELGLKLADLPRWHVFPPPGGVTGMYLLTESHLTCHTYPEVGAASFNLYCCRQRSIWPWEVRLAELLDAKEVTIRFVERTATLVESSLPLRRSW